MRVDEPDFFGEISQIICYECPFTDEHGHMADERMKDACELWAMTHRRKCPRNKEEYHYACLMAEEAAKGGKG